MSEASGKYPSDFKKKKMCSRNRGWKALSDRYAWAETSKWCGEIFQNLQPFHTNIFQKSYNKFNKISLLIYIYIYDHTVQICLIWIHLNSKARGFCQGAKWMKGVFKENKYKRWAFWWWIWLRICHHLWMGGRVDILFVNI